MMRCIVLLAIVLASLSCSKDRPVPVTPAGKSLSSLAAPDPPTNLRITDLTKTSVKLRWDAVEGATDYDVSYRRTAGGEWKAVNHEDTKLYSTLTGLEPNTEYSWAVRAENDKGASAWVYADNFTTLRDQAESGEGTSQPEEPSTRAPDPPTNLRIEAITNTSARVRWDAVEGSDRLRCQLQTHRRRRMESSAPCRYQALQHPHRDWSRIRNIAGPYAPKTTREPPLGYMQTILRR